MLATDYCPGCGELKAIAHDPMRAWKIGFDECRRCYSLEYVQRQRADDDAKAEKAGAKTYPGARAWWIREYDWKNDPDAELEALTNGGQDSNRQVPGGRSGSDSEHRPPDEIDRRLG
jgi:hypothetical protein